MSESVEKSSSPEEINKMVLEYKREIESINKKIDSIQSNCKHTEYDIKTIGMGPVKVRKVCKVCDIDLGYPSKEELEKAGY